jgi:hypothetical protein
MEGVQYVVSQYVPLARRHKLMYYLGAMITINRQQNIATRTGEAK